MKKVLLILSILLIGFNSCSSSKSPNCGSKKQKKSQYKKMKKGKAPGGNMLSSI
jgi:hypothetical protein